MVSFQSQKVKSKEDDWFREHLKGTVCSAWVGSFVGTLKWWWSIYFLRQGGDTSPHIPSQWKHLPQSKGEEEPVLVLSCFTPPISPSTKLCQGGEARLSSLQGEGKWFLSKKA